MNCQDPALLRVDNTWYAFAGINDNPFTANVLVWSSPDFSNWTINRSTAKDSARNGSSRSYDALPTLGTWADHPGHVWAPGVSRAVS